MAAYLDCTGTLLLLYRSGRRKPYVTHSMCDMLREGSRIRGPLYVNNMAACYKRLREAVPDMLKDASIKVRSSGGINNINIEYRTRSFSKMIHLISSEALNIPDSLPVHEVLIFLDTVRQAVGYWPYSIGAAATRFYSETADLHPAGRLNDEQRELVRSSYFGGFNYLRPGVGYVKGGFVYDINKLYSYILRNKPLPLGTPKEFTGSIPENKYKFCDNFYFHKFRVTAKLRSGKLPFIQLRHDWSVKQGYQSEIIDKTLVLSKPDMELFRDNYRILSYEPIGGLEFGSCDYMFRDHIDRIFKLIELSKSSGERAAYKLLSNALYGQYGRRDIIGRVIYKEGAFEYDPEFKLKSTAYIPVASAIAAYGRSIIIPAAQREGSNFIYSDTDSIHCFRESRHIKTSDRLGDFKLEEHFEEARYFGRRKYVLLLSYSPEIKKVVMAGLPASSTKNISYFDFVRGDKIPMVRHFIKSDGSVEKVNMTYEI